MGYILLIIESLATSWLFVALLVAYGGRLGKPLARLALTAVAVLVPFVCYSIISGIDGFLEFGKRVHTGLFWPLMGLVFVYSVGAVELARRSRIRQTPEDEVASRNWAPGKLAAALVVAVSLLAMTFANLDTAAKQSLSTVRAEANALALSVAPERLPAADNAALIYYQAFDDIGTESTGPFHEWPQIWQDAAEALDAEKRSDFDFGSPELGQFLGERAGLLALLHQAAAKPGCYFDRDFGRPTADMLLPELQDLRTSARLLAVHARWSAQHGKLQDALGDVNSMYAIARHVGMEPILVSMLVAAAIDTLASETLEVVVSGKLPTPEALTVIDLDGAVSFRRILGRTLRMEEAFILNLFASLDGMDFGSLADMLQTGNDRAPLDHLGPVYRVFLLSDDLAGYHAFMHAAEQSVGRQSYKMTKPQLVALDQGVRGGPGILTALVTPSLVNCYEAAVRADANRSVARVGLAMLRYRAANGQFPDRLDQLSPEYIPILPRDPYDSKPLRLKKSAGGWTVYSIGPNLKDEGGRRKREFADNVFQGDLGFEYVGPKSQGEAE